jgi:vitamin B12 transporter
MSLVRCLAPVAGVILALQLVSPAAAQTPAASALEECARAAAADDRAAARNAADRAESLFRDELRESPGSPEPRVGLARVISQCRIRFANFMSAGRLIGESNRLLEEALELDPAHWTARFALAQNHYHSPEFLGRTRDAIHHLEILRVQQGERTESPMLASTFVYLGDLYRRTGRHADAVGTWEQGARLFPDDRRLAERLESHRPTVVPAGSETSGVDALPGTARYAVDGVTVRTRRHSPRGTAVGISVDRMQVLTVPGGAGDVLHGLRAESGVSPGTDGSDLFVRGGDPAETPVWVDGGRLFYPGTFESPGGGLFGALDPSVLSEAYFSSGGFSARYGNALSGVLDVRTEGRPVRGRLHAGASLAGVNGVGRTVLGSRGGAWASAHFVDARLLVRMQGLGHEYERMPRAVKASAGVVHEPRSGVELKASLLVEEDAVTRRVESHGHSGAFATNGGIRHGVLSARAGGASGAHLRGSLAVSERRTSFSFGVLDRERRDRAVSASWLGAAPLGERMIVRGGMEAHRLALDEDGRVPTTSSLAPGAPASPVEASDETHHWGVFVENELGVTERWSVLGGLRADRLPGETGWTADPRLTVAYRSGAWTSRLSGGVFQQGRWRVGYRIPDAGTPSGMARRARHLALGLQQDGPLGLRVESYVKAYDRYVADGDGPQIEEAWVAGVDSRMRWTLGELLSGWIVYSYLTSQVSLEDGRTVPARTEVTHALTGVGKLAIGRSFELGTTMRLATGRPFTPVTGVVAPPDRLPTPVYGEMHSERMPTFMRLDARLTHLGQVGGRPAIAFVEVLNALDRRNVMGYTYDAAYRERRPINSFFAHRVVMIGTEMQLR